MAARELAILIRAKNEASAAFQSVKKDTRDWQIELLAAQEKAERLQKSADRLGTELSRLRADKAAAEVKRLAAEAEKATSPIGRLGESLTKFGKVAAVGLGAGVLAVGAGIAAFTAKAHESMQITKQLDAVLRSTAGAAGVTRDAALDLSKSLESVTNFDDEAVLSTENLLLTFTKIGKDIFPQATETVLDMATALGTDTTTAAIQVGKALQDPINGITALRRVGVNFSDAQKDVIDNLVKTGQSAEAQRLILKELATEFGGSARAAADPMKQLKNTIEDVEETLGAAFLPVMQRAANALRHFVEDHQQSIEAFADLLGKRIPQALDVIARAFELVASKVAPAFAFLDQKDKIAILAAVAAVIAGPLVAAVVAFGVASAAAFATNPITLFAAAIAGVSIAITLLVRHWDSVWTHLQDAPVAIVRWLRDNWLKALLVIFTGGIGLLALNWAKVWGLLPTPVQRAMNVVAGIIETAVNGIIKAINKIGDAFETVIGGVGEAVQKMRVPGARTLLDQVGLTSDFANALKNFSIADIPQVSISFGKVGEHSDIFGGIADAFGGLTDSMSTDIANLQLPVAGLGTDLDALGGAAGGAAQAVQEGDAGLKQLAEAFDAFHAATGEGLDTFLALIQVQKDRVDLDKRAFQASVNLKAAQIEAADSAFQLKKGLVEIAEKMAQTGETITEIFRDIARAATDKLRSAFDALFARPTREGAELQLRIDELELRRAQAKINGASEDEIRAIQDQIDRLREEQDVREASIKVLKDKNLLADQTLITDQQQQFAATLYTIALQNQSASLAALSAQADLEAIARQHLIDSMLNAAAANNEQAGISRQQSSLDFFNSLPEDQRIALARLLQELARQGRLASGTTFWRGGTALVGEHGPELVSLPRGTAVLPADQTANLLNNRPTEQRQDVRIFIDTVHLSGDPVAGLTALGVAI